MNKKNIYTLLFFLFVMLYPLDLMTQEQLVTLTGNNITLKTAFDQIEKQTNLSIDYDANSINVNQTIISIPNSNKVSVVLDTLLDGMGYTYKFNKSHVIITVPKELSSEKHNLDKTRSITGLITDNKGEPIIGATVKIKGSQVGTITDYNGSFFILALDNDILEISYLGYVSENIPVKNKLSINVTLKEDNKMLDEVVVVGYGTSQKKDLTGAVGIVRGDVIESRQSVQVSQALQGAVAGLTVTRSSGAPGSTSTIRVRGITTLGDSDALVIVDGVPSDGIDNVNPADIESISVLKDAASASIYGSRAAAGVILVSTKRAKEGQAQFAYNYEFGVEKPVELPEYVDVVRYMQLVNERQLNDGGSELYSETFINEYWANHTLDPDGYPATDWQSVLFKNFAPRHRHELTLTMGTKAIKTKASFNYTSIDGLYSNSTYDRYMFRLNNDININKLLSANIDISYKHTLNQSPAPNEVSSRSFTYLARVLPGIYNDVYDDGRYAPGKDGLNILAETQEGGNSWKWYNKLTGRFVLDFKPFKGFSVKALLAPILDFNKSKTFSKVIEYTEKDDPARIIATSRAKSDLSEDRIDRIGFNGQFLINYNHNFKGNNFNYLLGYEENSTKYESLTAYRDNFMIYYPYLNLGSEENRDNGSNAYEVALRSFFGRIDYNYKQKYFLQFNARYDGSSRFHENHRWAFFPSVSAGWIITEENFMKDVGFLPYFKLRGSIGRVGNERIGNYPYQASIIHYNALFYRDGELISEKTGAQTTYAVEDITWEKTQSYDLGFDAAFFNQRLSVSGDYYKKNTTDILLELDIPLYLGYIKPYQNAGAMSAKGWELELSWKDKIGNLSYSAAFNISDVKTGIDDLKGTQLKGDQAKLEGGEFNEWYGYKSKGIYQTWDQIDNSATMNANVMPGDIWYDDISGPDGVPDGEINDYDKVLLGGSLPRYIYGGNINLGYKGIDFSLSFNGVGKQTSRLSNVQIRPFQEGGIGNVPKIIDGKFWSINNTDEQNLAAQYPRLSTVGASNNYVMSDFWLINGAYFRIKNITLGYNIPLNQRAQNYIKKTRLYVAINDIVSINKYPKGWDPETTATGYPIVTTFMAGVNVNF